MDTYKSIRVLIFNREYPLKVRAEDEHATRELAALVDTRMQSIRRQVPGEPDLTVAVLASMAIAEEMLQQRRETSLREADVLNIVESLTDHLKGALETDQ